MKIRSVGAELFFCGRTGITKEIVAFRILDRFSKKLKYQIS